jgi:hypothetical protein|eukprot:COSAG01_NODE_3514_length_5982_cov_5.029917_4_plen_340_part_00
MQFMLTPRTEFRLAAAASTRLSEQLQELERCLLRGGGPYLYGALLSVDDCRLGPQLHSAVVALRHFKQWELDTGRSSVVATVMVDGKLVTAEEQQAQAAAEARARHQGRSRSALQKLKVLQTMQQTADGSLLDQAQQQQQQQQQQEEEEVRYPAIRRYLNALLRHPLFPVREESELLALHEAGVDAFVAGSIHSSRRAEDELVQRVHWAVVGPHWRLRLQVTIVAARGLPRRPRAEEAKAEGVGHYVTVRLDGQHATQRTSTLRGHADYRALIWGLSHHDRPAQAAPSGKASAAAAAAAASEWAAAEGRAVGETLCFDVAMPTPRSLHISCAPPPHACI